MHIVFHWQGSPFPTHTHRLAHTSVCVCVCVMKKKPLFAYLFGDICCHNFKFIWPTSEPSSPAIRQLSRLCWVSTTVGGREGRGVGSRVPAPHP